MDKPALPGCHTNLCQRRSAPFPQPPPLPGPPLDPRQLFSPFVGEFLIAAAASKGRELGEAELTAMQEVGRRPRRSGFFQ